MMKIELFIANRMRSKKHYKNSVSNRIIKIAVFAVSLGIIMMIISISVGFGFQKEIKDKTSAFTGHIIVSPFENNNSSISITPFDSSNRSITKVLNLSQITNYNFIVNKGSIIKSKSDFDGIILKGVGKKYLWENISFIKMRGQFLKTSGNLKNEIFLSKRTSEKLDVSIGDTLSLFFQNNNKSFPSHRKLIIVGYFESGFPDFDDNFAMIDIRHIQKINNWKSNQIGRIEIFINDINNLDNITNKIYENLPPEIDAVSVKSKYKNIYDWIALFDFNILIIISLMLVIAIFNMATALFVLIIDRTRMIGLLKSLGAKNSIIQKVFLVNSFYILLEGLFYGNLIGLIIILAQDRFGIVKLDPSIYYVSDVPIFISFKIILLLNFGVLFFCMISLWIPSLIISKVSPSNVMRLN